MDASAAFQAQFQRKPTVTVAAPGRINLIGEHIDYLDGWVLPAAIDRFLHIAAAPSEGPDIRIWSPLSRDRPATLRRDQLNRVADPDQGWLNYIVGVLAGYREAGVNLPPFDAAICSDLPSGAGLSSSAALETATALTVEALTGTQQDVVDRALICQRAEHLFAGVPCGIMDQLAVGASRARHAILIDCRDLSLETLPLPPELSLVVADTGVKHALGDGEYRKRRQDCESALELLRIDSFRNCTMEQLEAFRSQLGDRLFRRARHAITEMGRVHQFASALQRADRESMAALLREGHESLRQDFEVSCPELDLLVEAAYQFEPRNRFFGSRMTGGGFGGATISLVHRQEAAAFQSHLENAFEARFSRAPEVFLTSTANGARIVEPATPPRSSSANKPS